VPAAVAIGVYPDQFGNGPIMANQFGQMRRAGLHVRVDLAVRSADQQIGSGTADI